MSNFPSPRKGLICSVSIVTVVSLFAIPVFLSSAQSFTFPSAFNLSNDTYNAQYPMVANTGSNVYVVWTEESHGVYFRLSADGGSYWWPSLTVQGLRLSPTGGTTSYPVITANGSNVYVAWSQTLN